LLKRTLLEKGRGDKSEGRASRKSKLDRGSQTTRIQKKNPREAKGGNSAVGEGKNSGKNFESAGATALEKSRK